MEEKERYELIGYCSYRDTETGVIGDNFVELLNQQEKENQQLKQSQKQLAISELEKVKEKALHFYVSDTPKLTSFYVDVKEIDSQIKSLKGEE